MLPRSATVKPAALVALAALASFALVCSAGCTAEKTQILSAAAVSPALDAYRLPAPDKLPAGLVQGQDVSRFRYGNEFDPALLHNCEDFVSNPHNVGLFQPGAEMGKVGDAAFALYRLDIPSEYLDAGAGNTTLTLYAGDTVAGTPAQWIGLANFSTGRWDWQPWPANGELSLDLPSGRYTSPAGQLCVVPLTTGAAGNIELRWLRLGPNMPPQFSLLPSGPEEYFNTLPCGVAWTIVDLADPDARDGDPEPVKEYAPHDTAYLPYTLPAGAILNDCGKSWIDFRATDVDGGQTTLRGTFRAGWMHSLHGPNPSSDGTQASAFEPGGTSYTCGSLHSCGIGGYDAAVQKRDPDGTLKWDRIFGSTSFGDIATDIALDSVGNVYVCGLYGESIDNGTLFINKIDSTGALKWQKFYNDSFSGRPRLALTASDAVCVAATHNSLVDETIFYAVLDTAGGEFIAVDIGRGGCDARASGICRGDMGMTICGTVKGLPSDPNATQLVAFEALPENGQILWQQAWGASSLPEDCFDITPAGPNYLVCSNWDSGGTGNGVVSLINGENGTPLFMREYSLVDDGYEDITGGVVLEDGSFVLSAQVYGTGGSYDFGLLHLSPDGELLDQRGWGSSSLGELPQRLSLGADGSLLFAGSAYNFDSGQLWHEASPSGVLLDYDYGIDDAQLVSTDSSLVLISNMGLYMDATGVIEDDPAAGGAVAMRYWY